MTSPDPVLARLAELPAEKPSAELAERLRAKAHARLRPRPMHPVWAVVAVSGVVGYLSWAVQFSASLR